MRGLLYLLANSLYAEQYLYSATNNSNRITLQTIINKSDITILLAAIINVFYFSIVY